MSEITEDPNWLQDLMSRTDFITLELMRAAGVAANNRAVKPYWKKLAVWMQDFCIHPDAVQIAKDLCRYHGADPEQKSLGLGSIIARDQEYHLWQAWTPLSDAYIKACAHYDKRG